MLKKLSTMLFHEELFTRSQCSCCQYEITGRGVECLECYNGTLRLCVECFDSQAEIGQHNSNHQYKFFDSGSMVLSLQPVQGTDSQSLQIRDPEQEQKFSAREEIRLLDAIEQYGFGNWQDISKHIETKTSVDAKSKYVNRYVDGTLGQLTWSQDIGNEVTRNICIANLQKPFDHTIPSDDGPLSPSLTQRLPPLDIGLDEMLQLGYMPYRDDYEKEFDNDAEKLVSQLSFTAEDEEVDVGLKLALVDMYTRRLRERARRKRMIRDYQLVSKFFRKDKMKTGIVCFEWNITKDVFRGQFATFERSLLDSLRPFVQFFNSREFEFFIRNVTKEMELKFRLTELYKYRSNGIVRSEECYDFERTRNSFTILRGGKRNLEAILENEEVKGRSGNKKAHLDEKFVAPLLVRQLQLALPQSSPNSKSSPSLSTVENDVKGGESLSAVRNLTPQQFSNGESSLKNFMASSELGRALYPQEEPKATQLMEVLTQVQPVNESSSLQKEEQKASADQFTADYTPSSDLVTDTEFLFCLKVRLTPAQYLTSKTALLLARKPKTEDNQQSEELIEIGCPPGIRQDEWEQVITFFKRNYC